MDDSLSENAQYTRNGHTPDLGEHTPINAYAEAIRGERPQELVEFDLGTDPYANMLPRIHTHTEIGEPEDRWDEPRRRNPVLIAISILLIVVLILPVVVAVFVRLGI